MKDKLDLFKIIKYQCEGSKELETSVNQHTYIQYIQILQHNTYLNIHDHRHRHSSVER